MLRLQRPNDFSNAFNELKSADIGESKYRSHTVDNKSDSVACIVSCLSRQKHLVFRGGVKLTVQGQNMDVVLNSRMIVTVKIRRSRRVDDDSNGEDDDYEELHYPPTVCVPYYQFHCDISHIYFTFI